MRGRRTWPHHRRGHAAMSRNASSPSRPPVAPSASSRDAMKGGFPHPDPAGSRRLATMSQLTAVSTPAAARRRPEPESSSPERHLARTGRTCPRFRIGRATEGRRASQMRCIPTPAGRASRSSSRRHRPPGVRRTTTGACSPGCYGSCAWRPRGARCRCRSGAGTRSTCATRSGVTQASGSHSGGAHP